MSRILVQPFVILLLFQALLSFPAWSAASPESWAEAPENQVSARIEPLRVSARTADGLELQLKHYAHAGAQPVLLLHGLAQNDRCWDSKVTGHSFARFLHAQGFDVWIGNERGSGTPGFRSDTPAGPHHWTVEDYAIFDIPALVDTVRARTGQAPLVIGHSLAAWALDGYLSGLRHDAEGTLLADFRLAGKNRAKIKGLATIAGVYNVHWNKRLSDVLTDPVRSEIDYYHSNYELEALAKARPLYHVVPKLPALPLGWIGSVLNLPLERIPFVGDKLRNYYYGFQDKLVETPILSMFYFSRNIDPEVVRRHAEDGLEDLGPRLIEQLANAINDGIRSSYYHLNRPRSAWDYAPPVSARTGLPMLFVAGDRDRLANADMIFTEGYEKALSFRKQYLRVPAGHLDILSGNNAIAGVMIPVTRWLRENQ